MNKKINRIKEKNAVSNSHVGADFEGLTFDYFKEKLPLLKKPFTLPIGLNKKKNHKFDMGCMGQKILIECKSHTWTESYNIPSAKLTTWDQTMFYFLLAPSNYRKIFVSKFDFNPEQKESLSAYYLRTHYHVIPDNVEFWEVDEENNIFMTRKKNKRQKHSQNLQKWLKLCCHYSN